MASYMAFSYFCVYSQLMLQRNHAAGNGRGGGFTSSQSASMAKTRSPA
jgi:hypothetical protein